MSEIDTLLCCLGCQCREPLTLLAAMPPGNVAGVIDLEVTEDGRPGGYGRMARLSEAAARKIKLPWKCWARLLVGNLLLTHWKVWLLWFWSNLGIGLFKFTSGLANSADSFRKQVQDLFVLGYLLKVKST